MLQNKEYPIMEFDDEIDALINPTHLRKKYGALPTDKLVITFFREVIDALLAEDSIYEYQTIRGENSLVLYKYRDADVMLIHGTVGCPACAGFMEDLIGLGIRKIMFCGGGGVLDANIQVGELLVVEGAIRDEGLSYHYAPPSRIIYVQQDVQDKICAWLKKQNIPHLRGLTWTTDAFYRETRQRILARKKEGAKIVEMEQSGCIAVAQFRNVKYGAIIYGGDDVSAQVWDSRSWRSRESIRSSLVGICKDLVYQL